MEPLSACPGCGAVVSGGTVGCLAVSRKIGALAGVG